MDVVILDEGPDLVREITWLVIDLQQDAVLQRLMPAFNLVLCRRIICSPSDVPHFLIAQPFGQFTRDVAGPVARQQ